MARQTIDYGIDLGTTNSSIARMEDGEPRILKNPLTQMDTTPSAIHYTQGRQLLVGVKAYEKIAKSGDDLSNTFIEFKRTMGTDLQYYSFRTGEYYTPEVLSAEVLKELRRFVTDEGQPEVAIITVPADFHQVQIAATQRAAELAGFKYCELLQEPIAASLAYGFSKRKSKGSWLVFDLGGGTFDAALVRMEGGIIKVIDHAGDNRLGGKNMDELIVDNIILPHLEKNFALKRTMEESEKRNVLARLWKQAAEEAKKRLSTYDYALIDPDTEKEYPECKDENGYPIDAVIRIERSQFESLIDRLIDRAIKMATDLVIRNRISPDELETVLLVGGPTYIPYLRKRITEEVNERVNVSIDPMTVVVKGAAIFASIRAVPVKVQKRDVSKVQLVLGYPSTTVEVEVSLGLRVDQERMEKAIRNKIYAEIARLDKGWATGRIELVNGAAIVRLHLLPNEMNDFTINLYDDFGNRIDCEPTTFSILQGVKIANPTLPHDIGISAMHKESGETDELFVPILSKNQTLPATGKKTFTVAKNLRPGNPDDVFNVLVWEGKAGTRPERNDWVGRVAISGVQLPSLLPKGSEVEITLRMDESRRITVNVFFPYLGETIEDVLLPHIQPNVDPNWVVEVRGTIKRKVDNFTLELIEIDELKTDDLEEIKGELYETEELIDKGLDDYDRGLTVKNRLNELLIRLDEIERDIKWPLLEKKARDEITVTKDSLERYGTEQDREIFTHLQAKLNRVVEAKNPKLVESAISELQTFKWQVCFRNPKFWIDRLLNIGDYFHEIHWSNRRRANELLNEGKTALSTNGYSDQIPKTVVQLWDLMPEDDVEKTKTPRDDLPITRY